MAFRKEGVIIFKYCYSRAGSAHIRRGIENQDALCTAENENYAVLALADGVGSCEMAAAGARSTVETVCDYLLVPAVAEMEDRKLVSLLMDEVLCRLSCLARRDGRAISDYASTLAVCLINKKTGTVRSFSLGNSAVYLSGTASCRRVCRSTPFFTTTLGAANAVERAGFRLMPHQKLILCSDGFLELMSNSELSLRCQSPQAFRAMADAGEPDDDCSFIIASHGGDQL